MIDNAMAVPEVPENRFLTRVVDSFGVNNYLGRKLIGRSWAMLRRLFLAVGSKSEQKGFDLLIEAYTCIAYDHPDWDAAGLAEHVHFSGRVANVSECYERADVFVLSSCHDGFPHVLLEAIAAGCACVAFDCDIRLRDLLVRYDEKEVLGQRCELIERLVRC